MFRRWRSMCRRRVHRRRGMLWNFPVHHGPGGLAFVQVLLLLWFQRTSGVLLHGRSLLLVRQLLLRRRIFAHQRRPVCWRSATVHFRSIGRRVCNGTCVRRRRGVVGRHRLLTGPHHWRVLNDRRPLRRHWRMDSLISPPYGPGSWIDLRMRNYLCSRKLLRFDCHQIAMHLLTIAESIGRNCGGGCRLIAVMDVVDVGYVRNVRDIDVVYIGHVNLAQIDIAVVIPGKERLAWTERKPGHHAADAEAHRKSRTAGERHERRTINRRYGNRPGYPTPPRADQQPASKMKRSESPGGSVHPGPAPGLNPDPAPKAVRIPSDG